MASLSACQGASPTLAAGLPSLPACLVWLPVLTTLACCPALPAAGAKLQGAKRSAMCGAARPAARCTAPVRAARGASLVVRRVSLLGFLML
jgi:hypothetical protein